MDLKAVKLIQYSGWFVKVDTGELFVKYLIRCITENFGETLYQLGIINMADGNIHMDQVLRTYREEFTKLKVLKRLYLINNGIDDSLMYLQDLPSLEYADLSCNKICKGGSTEEDLKELRDENDIVVNCRCMEDDSVSFVTCDDSAVALRFKPIYV